MGIYDEEEIFHEDSRTKKIDGTLEEGDFALAKIMVDYYEENHILPHQDIKKLRLKIERSKKGFKLQQLIEDYNTEEAYKYLAELKERDLYSPKQIRDFEQKIKEATPDGLTERIIGAEGENAIKPCREYLCNYPEGKDFQKIVEILLVKEFDYLTKKLKEEVDVDSVIGILRRLNQDLKKYENIKTNLHNILSKDLLEESIEDYMGLKRKYGEEKNFHLAINDQVLVFENVGKSWTESYFSERTSNFPEGSKGVIVGVYKDGYMVEFEKGKYYWSTSWGEVGAFWKKKGHKGVAKFRKEELRLLKPLTKVKLNELEFESARTVDNYSKCGQEDFSPLWP